MQINLYECFECSSTEHIHMHHVIPRSKGGIKTLPLCAKCHGLVHDKDLLRMQILQKEGIKKAIEKGIYKGREKGAIESEEHFLSKYMDVPILINEGMSYRNIAKKVNISLGTVQKVKKLMNIPNKTNYEKLLNNYKYFIEALNNGNSIRKNANIFNIPITTARRIAKNYSLT